MAERSNQEISIEIEHGFEGQIEFLEEAVAVELVSVMDADAVVESGDANAGSPGIFSIPVSLEAEAVLDFIDGDSVVDLTSYGLGYEANAAMHEVNGTDQFELNFTGDVLTVFADDFGFEAEPDIII